MKGIERDAHSSEVGGIAEKSEGTFDAAYYDRAFSKLKQAIDDATSWDAFLAALHTIQTVEFVNYETPPDASTDIPVFETYTGQQLLDAVERAFTLEASNDEALYQARRNLFEQQPYEGGLINVVRTNDDGTETEIDIRSKALELLEQDYKTQVQGDESTSHVLQVLHELKLQDRPSFSSTEIFHRFPNEVKFAVFKALHEKRDSISFAELSEEVQQALQTALKTDGPVARDTEILSVESPQWQMIARDFNALNSNLHFVAVRGGMQQLLADGPKSETWRAFMSAVPAPEFVDPQDTPATFIMESTDGMADFWREELADLVVEAVEDGKTSVTFADLTAKDKGIVAFLKQQPLFVNATPGTVVLNSESKYWKELLDEYNPSPAEEDADEEDEEE